MGMELPISNLDIEKMLRMYLMQSWFNLSDEGIEDAIYDSYATFWKSPEKTGTMYHDKTSVYH